MADDIDKSEICELRVCRFCNVAYLQRGRAGVGKCDDCFRELINAEMKDAKEWAESEEGKMYILKTEAR